MACRILDYAIPFNTGRGQGCAGGTFSQVPDFAVAIAGAPITEIENLPATG